MSDRKKSRSGGLKSIPGGKSGKSGGGNGAGTDATDPKANPFKILDFTAAKEHRTEENRRSVERYFMQHLVDVFCEIDGKEPLPIELVEISESGCSFRLVTEKVKILPKNSKGEFLPITTRVYFSKQSYLKVGFNIISSTADIGGGVQMTRFGCKVDEAFASSAVYSQFARFMESFAAHCCRDTKQIKSM